LSKVCIIGMDGGTFTAIDYLIAQGRMPNMARLIKTGSRATLMSTVPPLTWPAWASFYTGTNPGKTGASDLFKFQAGTYKLEPMNAGNIRGVPIWSLAGDSGKRVCVYNVPVTYPAIPVNGILVSGLDAPSFNDRAIYPLEQKEELLAKVPDFQITFENDAKYLVTHHKDPIGEWIRQANAFMDMELRTIDYLMHLEDWDLFATVIRSTDIIPHTHWRMAEKVIDGESVTAEEQVRAEAVFNCYEVVDRKLGEIAANLGPDKNLVIMSDHGFGRMRGTVCVNRVLAEAGLLKFHPVSSRSRTLDFVKKQLKTHLSLENKQRVRRMLGKDRLDSRWTIYVDTLIAEIDWSQTKICAIGGFGNLYLNLKDRDPMGIVGGEDERRAVIEAADAALRELKDPWDGEPILTRSYRKEELFHGPCLPELPDMVLNLRNWSYCPVIGTANELSAEALIRPPVQQWKQLAHTGTHRREGILIMNGPDIAASDIGVAQMVDIAPTVMNLLGLPAYEEWDGKILEAAMSNGSARSVDDSRKYRQAGEEETASAYSSQDEEEVRKHLEDLGYL